MAFGLQRRSFPVRLRGALAATAAVLALGLSGPARAGTVDFWTLFSGPDGAAIEKLVNEFNSTAGKETDVQVKLLIIPWNDFNTKLSVAMASRKAPALTVVNSDQVALYANQGTLEPFTDEELAAAGIRKDDYVPAAWNAGTFKDKQYGIPISIFPRSLYFNKALLEKAGLDPMKPPATKAELLDYAQKTTDKANGVYGLFFSPTGIGTVRNFYSVYWQYADSIYNDDMSDVSDGFKETATKVLNDFKTFMDAGVVPDKDVSQDVTKLFAQNKIGMAVMQITDLPVFQAAARDLGLQYGIAGFPQIGERPAVFALAHEFLIPRGTSEAARKDGLTFIKWLGAHGVDWAKTGKVSPQRSVIDSAEYKALPEQEIVTGAIDTARFPPPIVKQPAVDKAVQQVLEQFFARRIDVDEAVEELASGIGSAL
ncbi:extracellular solute-binding protein [Aureimonas leprariae]|uniref:Extracellular solute-binding protein n=1 Tax=Plantimonas leprariae TaxID=2615207 RepID=A0A7V7PMN8_9HYPH|nr:extracellular solute-binding protein [Aureimonas leprariae]KAB0678545.1 extracellular solute-binding protein [Aureimonas leprariae]